MRKNLYFFLLFKIILFNTYVLHSFQICFLTFMSNKRVIFINVRILFTWIVFTFKTVFHFSMLKTTLSNFARLITVTTTTTMIS